MRESSLRVLNVNMVLDTEHGGGTAERTWQLSRALAAAGVHCTMLCVNLVGDSGRWRIGPGLEMLTLPCWWRRFYVPGLPWRRVAAAVGAANVVHLMGHWTLVNAVAYWAARRLGRPYVVCPAGALTVYGRSKRLKRLYNVAVGTSMIRGAAAHVAITEREREEFRGYGIRPEDVVVIPNGIVPDPPEGDGATFRARYGLGSRPFVLFVGRLNTIKGPDLLLEAFAAGVPPDVDLVFAGPDGGLRSALLTSAMGLGLGHRVHFVGYVGGADKAAAYRAAECVVVPSRREAMSLVVLEAAQAGRAVLITDQCGFDEVAAVGGGLVVPASVEGLHDGLQLLLADRKRLRAMGERLRAGLTGRFSWERSAQAYIALYHRVLGTRVPA